MNFAARAALLLGLQFLAAGLSAATSYADDGPICRRPEVLSFAMDNFRKTAAHIELVADTATEFATSRADVVICAVTVQVKFYGPADHAGRATVLKQPRYFEVKRLKDGFEINFDGR